MGSSTRTRLSLVVSTGGAEGSVRNRGGPTAQPWSGPGGSYKPKAKGTAAQRESEGIVVPEKAVKAAGGKGPCGGGAEGE